MEYSQVLVLLLTVLLLGIVHGIDWDHLAAISDIAGSTPERRRGFWLATLYAIGHGFANIVLGILAIYLGTILPDWTERVLEPVVGMTLIILALWIVYAIFNQGDRFQLRGRWMLVLDMVRAAVAWAGSRLRGDPRPFNVRTASSYGAATAFGIGMIHGIGAETATQALLFVSVAGAGGVKVGGMMLGAWVLGLMCGNTTIAITSSIGIRWARRSLTARRMVGGTIATFSLLLGIVFLTGLSAALPTMIPWEPTL